MEINFTKNQFQTLLQLLYLGEWVANSYKIKEDKLYKESDSLEQHIFSFAAQFGLENLIEYDHSLKKFVPTLTTLNMVFLRNVLNYLPTIFL